MAHVRQDTLVKSIDWAKHLRPFLKRLVSKKERQAAKREIVKDLE